MYSQPKKQPQKGTRTWWQAHATELQKSNCRSKLIHLARLQLIIQLSYRFVPFTKDTDNEVNGHSVQAGISPSKQHETGREAITLRFELDHRVYNRQVQLTKG